MGLSGNPEPIPDTCQQKVSFWVIQRESLYPGLMT